MESIFKKIGYELTACSSAECTVDLEVMYINNPDGRPRWIWNAANKKPLFLKFYNNGSVRANAFSWLMKLIFACHLQRFFFHMKSFQVKKDKVVLFDLNEEWALFTGTVGPNNKAVFYVHDNFYKVALTPNARKLIHKEREMITKVNPSSFLIPEAAQLSDDILQVSDISGNGKRVAKIGFEHANALVELNFKQFKSVKTGEWELLRNLSDELNALIDARIPYNLQRKLVLLMNKLNPDELINTTFSHGDFTSWNCFLNHGKLAVYDWELASTQRPAGFDYFHFVVQQGILVDRKNWSSIYKELKDNCPPKLFRIIFHNNAECFDRYLSYYLLIQCMTYLKIYAEQPNWHVQVEWQLQTWSDALNMFLDQEKTNRQLFIMDFFDFLNLKNYAAIKFPNSFPEKLGLDSDIDLVVDKKHLDEIQRFVNGHSLVKKVMNQPQTFMKSIQAILNDGSVISIDLIWKLKRKSLVFMDEKALLKNSYKNNFGVKCASVKDTLRYISAFYTLNGAPIPDKFRVYQQATTNTEIGNDYYINHFFNETMDCNCTLKNYLKTQTFNRGIHAVKNKFLYVVDLLLKLNKMGFVVTFSGVDGAGKSTVIENVAGIIEKRLRKPVVVLRHRPSFLPIISVWFKGKEAAQQAVNNALPRQGTNKNVFSSALRFVYYYSDYFLGQFLVFFRYTLRGYVVLYDRYYFDFIGDARRSNICLPKAFALFGYKFLLKPKFNFFLFADVKTIRKRKKELEENAIQELTENYMSLFTGLKKKQPEVVYETVENTNLEATLNTVLGTIVRKIY